MIKKEVTEFSCCKCGHKYLGEASLKGEYALYLGDVKKIQLCSKCCR
jgi:hypothetical protein